MKNITLGDLTFAVQDEGDGPAVVLLHGFPDSHALWRKQVARLGRRRLPGDRARSARLRRVVQAGRGRASTRSSILAGDVLGILDSLERQRAHVVGHDWGAALAWAIGAFVPDRVDHLVALSVGHPVGVRATSGFEQRQKSWYMLLFQFEGIAEQWLSADDFANFREWSHHPDIDAGGRSTSHATGCADRRAQLVPRQRAPASVDRAAAGASRRCRRRRWACGAPATSRSTRRG